MDKNKIAEIASSVMYIEDPSSLDSTRSLFTEYNMSSLDFVDFAFELRSAAEKDFTPDDLWPVDALLADRTCFAAGTWTETGKAKMAEIFGEDFDTTTKVSSAELYPLFSIDFIQRRLTAI